MAKGGHLEDVLRILCFKVGWAYIEILLFKCFFPVLYLLEAFVDLDLRRLDMGGS